MSAIVIPSSGRGRHMWSSPSILVIFPQEGAERALPSIHSPHPNTFGNKGKGLSTHCAFFPVPSLPHSRSLTDPIDSAHSASPLPLIWKNHQPNHRSLILLHFMSHLGSAFVVVLSQISPLHCLNSNHIGEGVNPFFPSTGNKTIMGEH